MSLVEYVGAFVVSMDDGGIRRLYDSTPILKSSVSDVGAKKVIKELKDKIEIDKVASKAVNFT